MIIEPNSSNMLIYKINYNSSSYTTSSQKGGSNTADITFKNKQTGQRFISNVDMNSSITNIKTMIGNVTNTPASKINTTVFGMKPNNADSLNHHNVPSGASVSFSIKD